MSQGMQSWPQWCTIFAPAPAVSALEGATGGGWEEAAVGKVAGGGWEEVGGVRRRREAGGEHLCGAQRRRSSRSSAAPSPSLLRDV